MAEDRNEEDADPGEKEIYTGLKLKIDKNLPPTGFPHCDFIECGYFIHAVAKTNRLYDDIVVKLPIIIQYGDAEDWEEDEDAETKEEVQDDMTTDPITIIEGEIPDSFDGNDEEVDEEAMPIQDDKTDENLPGQVEQEEDIDEPNEPNEPENNANDPMED